MRNPSSKSTENGPRCTTQVSSIDRYSETAHVLLFNPLTHIIIMRHYYLFRSIIADINPDETAIDLFQEINRAYEVLRDPELRKLYDWYGQNGLGTSAYSDDINSQEASEEIEELQCGEISASFGNCLNPKGSQMKREAKKFHAKRRYISYRPQSFDAIQTKLKKEKQKQELSKLKGKHAFSGCYGTRAASLRP
jgi:hypothetical protein